MAVPVFNTVAAADHSRAAVMLPGGTLITPIPGRVIHETTARLTVSAAAGTKYIASPGSSDVSSLGFAGALSGVVAVQLTVADFTTAGNIVTLRLVVVETNTTAPAVTITAGLYPLTASGGNYALGTVVTGSTVPFASPGGNTLNSANSGDFTFPADGIYGVGYIVSGTPSGTVVLQAQLQVRVA